METVNKLYKMKFDRPAVNIKTNQLPSKYADIIKYYNTNSVDDYFDRIEIENIKKDVFCNAKNGNITVNYVSDLAKRIGTDSKSLMDFFHQINGAIIGINLSENMKNYNGIGLTANQSINIKNMLSQESHQINKKNIKIINDIFRNKFHNETLIDVLLISLSPRVSFPLIENFINVAQEKLQDDNIDISKEYTEFKEALQNRDEKNIKYYGNIICNKL